MYKQCTIVPAQADKMRAASASLNYCAVPFFSRATANLCWYYSSIGHSASTVVLRLSRGLQKEATEISVRFCSVRQKFCRTFCHSISCSLTIYGYKADRLCNSLQEIVFSVAAKFHNTYLDNSVLRCKTFGLLRGRILYSCFDFIVLAKLYM